MADRRDGADPDALWRPGYDGPWHTPSPGETEQAVRPPRRTTRIALGTSALVVAVVAIIVITAVRSGSDSSPGPIGEVGDEVGHAVEAPVDVLDEWSLTFTTIHIGALAPTDDALVVLFGRPATVAAIDRRDGSIRWSNSAPGASATGLDVVDGVVLTRHVEADGLGSAVAHDLESGLVLWRAALGVGERIDVIGGVPWLRTTGDVDAIPLTAAVGPADRGPAVPLPTNARPTDNVFRGVGPGTEITQVLPDAVVRIIVDGSTASVTLIHQADDDPSPQPSVSVP